MAQERSVDLSDRMSDHEALMWNIEKDPWMNSSGAALTLLDQPVDFDLFLRQVRYGAARMPRLYQRVAPGLGRLETPTWVPDPEFDLSYHVRRMDLPQGSGQRELFDLAAQLYNDPLDRTRPLWRFVVIGGLADGSGAIYSIFHHAISDGIGQMRMAEMYQGASRDEGPRPEVDLEGIIAKAAAEHERSAGGDLADDLKSTATAALRHTLHRNLGNTRRILAEASLIPADPSRLNKVIEQATATGAMVSGLVRDTGDRPAGSSLWGQRSRHRRLEYVPVSLDRLKVASKACGGTVNDGFIAGLAEGARRYHAERGVEVDGFNTSFIVSTRTDTNMGGNSFTPVPVRIEARAASSADRIAGVTAVAEAARERMTGSVSMTGLSGLANLLPTSVAARTARAQSARIDFATSNLRGAPFVLYCAGAEVLATVAMGPLAGTPMNVTALSYNGVFDLGLFIDPVAIEDPLGLRDHVAASFEDLLNDLAPVAAPTPAANKAGRATTTSAKPAAKSSANKKMAAATKPATKKPATKKKTAAKKPATKKPATKKPATPKTAVRNN